MSGELISKEFRDGIFENIHEKNTFLQLNPALVNRPITLCAQLGPMAKTAVAIGS